MPRLGYCLSPESLTSESNRASSYKTVELEMELTCYQSQANCRLGCLDS